MPFDRNEGRLPVVSRLSLPAFALAAVAFVRIVQFLRELPIAAPFQYDYEEGNILNALLRITHGATPYPDPHALPNVINPYGPAAYYLLVLPVKMFGVAFVYPRAMILGCAVLTAVLIAVELRRSTGQSATAVAFAVIFLSIPNVQAWAWLLRVDLLGIVLTTAGLMALSREIDRRPDHPRTALAAVLFALALLVKPTLFAAPAACFFALIARRRFHAAATLTALTAGVCAFVVAVFAALTHGAVLIDVFRSHPDPFSFRVYTAGMTDMLRECWPLVLLAVIALARDIVQRRFAPAAWWFLLAMATAITAGKLGSNANHFLEWNAAICVAAGLGFAGLTDLPSRKLAVFASVVALAASAFVISRQARALDNLGPAADCPRAYAWVRDEAGPNVLAENVGSLVLGGKQVWVSNPFVLAQLVEHAGWSDAELVSMVRERRFDAIITRMNYPNVPSFLVTGTERFSPELLRAIADNYDHEPGFICRDMNVLFKPKPAIQSNQAPR